jgi:hypothetical protein
MSNIKGSNSWERHSEKALHYYQNAREEIRRIPIEDGFYTDEKALRKAAGICWLAVAEAASGFLTRRGIEAKKLRSADAYRHLLSQHKEIDGKFFKHYESALQLVHIAIYYQGFNVVDYVKAGFDHAKFVIEKLTRMKL